MFDIRGERSADAAVSVDQAAAWAVTLIIPFESGPLEWQSHNTKGRNTMNLETLGKLLLDISNLSRDQKAIIFIELAKDFGFCVDGKKTRLSLPAETPASEAVSSNGAKRPKRHRYTIHQKNRLMKLANQWEPMTKAQQQDAIDSLAGQFHRTPAQIERQIHFYKTGK